MEPDLEMQQGLGLALREARQDKQLSQAELARQTGIHQTYLSGLECGHRNPSWAVIVALAQALEVAPSRLVTRAECLAN
jgi:transcriptional regulator with XRE-family HTH domain